MQKFSVRKADSQATEVKPISPEDFDFEAYAAYESPKRKRQRDFWASNEGCLVCRRIRVGEVFSYGCRDIKASLKCQLGALAMSMKYPMDIPNFLEPWYGVGIVPSAFGADYEWLDGQAPAVRSIFTSVREALDCEVKSVADTAIGRHTLEMIDYFMEKTGGRLPMSLTDMQSPLNIACSMIDASSFFMEMIDDPEGVQALLDKISGVVVDFNQAQLQRIGNAIVWPGHGFSSSRDFQGLGCSDDNIVMLSSELYTELAAPALVAACKPFEGVVFHSCGDWSGKIESVKAMDGIRMVDGAFSPETDPQPNPPEVFREALAGSGIVLNARIVGSADCVLNTVRKLWAPGMKLIVVTYCETPEEQAEVYAEVHNICRTEFLDGQIDMERKNDFRIKSPLHVPRHPRIPALK